MYRTLTDYFVEKSNGLITKVIEERDEGLGYTMTNSGGVEHEVGTFLYGLVRLLKPRMVLETGTYKGCSSSYMAQGLKDNATGMRETLEIAEEHIQTAKQLWHTLDLMKWITSYRISSGEFNPSCNYDMLFLDSEPNLRYHELVRFYSFLNPGGYVFIHDCPRSMTQGNINLDHPEIESWPFGNLPEEIKQWERTGELKRIHFPNPRGMCGWYKKHKDDYELK